MERHVFPTSTLSSQCTRLTWRTNDNYLRFNGIHSSIRITVLHQEHKYSTPLGLHFSCVVEASQGRKCITSIFIEMLSSVARYGLRQFILRRVFSASSTMEGLERISQLESKRVTLESMKCTFPLKHSQAICFCCTVETSEFGVSKQSFLQCGTTYSLPLSYPFSIICRQYN